MANDAFEQLLQRDSAAKRLAGGIREACLDRDHQEVLSLCREQWEKAKQLDYTSPEHVLIPAFIHGEFHFPETVKFPCLPIPHKQFGLHYVLNGITTATVAEFLLAEDVGATINVIAAAMFPTRVESTTQHPLKPYESYMREFVNKREALRKINPIAAESAKTFNNSMYGKIAQATRRQSSYSPSLGRMTPIHRSPVSEPCAAALITGQVRSCLSSVFFAIEDFNAEQRESGEPELTLISGTTDGCLAGVRNVGGGSVAEFYERNPYGELELAKEWTIAENVLERFNCKRLLELMEGYVPIRQLMAARYRLTGKPDFIEVKALADSIFALKTRLQAGWLATGDTVILAKGGHKPPIRKYLPDTANDPVGIERKNLERRWLEEQMNRKEGRCG